MLIKDLKLIWNRHNLNKNIKPATFGRSNFKKINDIQSFGKVQANGKIKGSIISWVGLPSPLGRGWG